MIIKDSVFAQAGQQDPNRTAADFRTGMVPNTVAMAEDVNTYGNWSDRDLKVVCDEIVNALRGQGITPNNSYDSASSTQLSTMLQTKLRGAYALTGIDYGTYTSAPTQSEDGSIITFAPFDVVFNNKVYYGNTQADMVRVSVAQQSLSATAGGWTNGVHYLFVNKQGAIQHQTTPVLGREGAEKCMLGSVFVWDGRFQAGSWKFQPWLQTTSMENRESPSASRKGGFISPIAGNAIQMGTVEILDEGINYGANPLTPNILTVQAQTPFTFKLLYPGYDAGSAPLTDLAYASTHIYNMNAAGTDGQPVGWEEIPQELWGGKYMCLVPCIVPTGQTLMIPAFSYKTGDTYTALFDSVAEATNAIFGLQYMLGNTASRAIYLGQTLIVRVGITDTLNANEFATVGVIPQALAGFTDASGQTGGGAGEYIPMREYTHNTDEDGSECRPAANTSYVVVGSSNVATNILPPGSATPGIVNQFSIKYTHLDGYKGLSFSSAIKWWYAAPQWVANNTYNIIIEYVDGKWIGGFLQTSIA